MTSRYFHASKTTRRLVRLTESFMNYFTGERDSYGRLRRSQNEEQSVHTYLFASDRAKGA